MMNPEQWRWYHVWMVVMNVLGLLSTLLTPIELAFLEVSPKEIRYLDIAEVFFVLDIVLQTVVAYNSDTSHDTIWRRILFIGLPKIILVIPCLPWVTIWKVYAIKLSRWMILSRMLRIQKVHRLLSKTEDFKIGFISTIDLKILAVNYITSHLICCTYLCSAMSMPHGKEVNTWLGILVMGEYNYSNFRHIGFRRLYITSLYFVAVTFSTIGYGDVHPVSEADMIIAIVVALCGFYWTDSYVKEFITKPKERESKTKTTNLVEKPLDAEQNSNQMIGLEHDADRVPTQEPLAIRLRKCRDRHRSCIQQVPLFKSCTEQFINEIASRVHREEFKPGQEVIEEGYILEQLYFLSSGELVKTMVGSEPITLTTPISFGDISILKNKPSPYTVRVVQPSTLLRLDKKTFNNIMNNYKIDRRTVNRNLVEDTNDLNILAHLDENFIDEEVDVNVSDSDILHTREDLLRKEVADLLRKEGAMIKDGGPFLCKAVETDDIEYVEWLLNCGMEANSKDKDGRTPLHFAARRGCVGMVRLLMRKGAKIQKDKWGASPREEAVLSGVDDVRDAVGESQLLILRDAGDTPTYKRKLDTMDE